MRFVFVFTWLFSLLGVAHGWIPLGEYQSAIASLLVLLVFFLPMLCERDPEEEARYEARREQRREQEIEDMRVWSSSLDRPSQPIFWSSSETTYIDPGKGPP